MARSLATPFRDLLVSAILYFECFPKISFEEKAPPWGEGQRRSLCKSLKESILLSLETLTETQRQRGLPDHTPQEGQSQP